MSSDTLALSPAAIGTAVRQRGAQVATLFKLRVVALLLLSAVTGAFVGAGGWPGLGTLAWLVLTGGSAAAGASAMNQYLERGQDSRMERTRYRPLAHGAIDNPERVLAIAAAMVIGAPLAALPGNPALAFFLALGAVIYVLVYTIWLKPRTPLNIVIGGLAGSCTALAGGAATGAWSEHNVLLLALLIFAWTPMHFWSLALACLEDYRRSGTPMLPTQMTPRRAAGWILAHALVASFVALLLVTSLTPQPAALIVVGVASLALLKSGASLWQQPSRPQAWRLFFLSNAYLGALLLLVVLIALRFPLFLYWR
jgi:protoheme IX farnesyltransferase